MRHLLETSVYTKDILLRHRTWPKYNMGNILNA